MSAEASERGSKQECRKTLTLVDGAVRRVVAALDTGAVARWLDQLDVVVVAGAVYERLYNTKKAANLPKADATLRVPLPASTAARVVLPASIVRIQAVNLVGVEAAGHCIAVSTR